MGPPLPQAIPVANLAEQKAYLAPLRCACGGRFGWTRERFLETGSGRHHDLMHGACAACGQARDVLFDISPFFSPGTLRFAMWACLVFLPMFLMAAASDDHQARRNRPALVIGALVSAALAAHAWRASRVGVKTLAAPAEAPAPNMPAVLAALGIPLDMGVSTPGLAFTGGLAKANIYQAWKALQENRLQEAAETLTGVVDMLDQGEERPAGVLAVARTLRGEAYERAGRTDEARADFEAALRLVPGHPGAAAGLSRLR